ncbi:hypothetical protein SLS58_000384 [Diplodia intermedia]|uniref:F-box domain-containing protein n=1 Tax=Diplodia intermedia TaxID=856260 RepID=A0ABR3U5S8_9PEZI
MDEVLDTPELLELILSKLPVKDLLLAQNVCKTFNTAIASSPTLQQALFLRPFPATATPPSLSTSTKLFHYPGHEPTIDRWERNPLLAVAFWPWFDRSTPESIFFPLFWDYDTFKELGLADAAKRSALLRPEASWRRMLLTQPPAAELQVMLQTCNRGGTSMADATICPGNGLRMGLLYDVTCQELLASKPRALRRFRVQWHAADRKIVLHFKCIRSCTDSKRRAYLVIKDYFSDAWGETTFEWRQRGSRGSDDIFSAGDYEA